MMRLLAAAALLWVLGACAAQAQLCSQNTTPQFTAGGNVFGSTSPQWNSYFGAKADINGGSLCNTTIQNLTVTGSATFPQGGLGTMAFQNADAVDITGGIITGLPSPTNSSDAATKGYVESYVDSHSNTVPDNSDTLSQGLSQTAIATFPNGVWRLQYFQASLVPPSALPPLPEWFTPETGNCSTNGRVNDGGSCVNSSADGNSWVGTVGPNIDPREWGAYCDIVGQPRGGLTYTVSVTNGQNVIDVQGTTIPATMVGGRIVMMDVVSGQANGATFDAAITGVASDGAGGTDVTVGTNWTAATLASATEPVWYGHDDAAAINAAIDYAGTVYGIMPAIYSGGTGCGVWSAPVNVDTAVNWGMSLYSLGAENLPIQTTAILEINGPGNGRWVGSFSTGFMVEGAFLPNNLVWMATNGFTHWLHGALYDWQGTTLAATLTGVSSINQSVVTGSIGSCSGSGPYTCTLTVTAVSSGSVQLGNSLSGSSIPAGTYVTMQSFPTAGGAGTYTIENATSNPGSIGSETIDAIGQDISATGAAQADIGMVSRNNGSYISDRTMVTGYNPVSGNLILNTAPVAPFSGQSITLYRDANGVVISGAGAFVGSNSAGWHLDQSNIRNAAAYSGYAANRYGCAIYNNAHGQSIFQNDVVTDGAVPICVGPNAVGSYFEIVQADVDSLTSGQTMVNAPAVTVMDGASATFLDFLLTNSQIQLTNSTLAQPSITVNQPKLNNTAASIVLAPDDTYDYYTEYAGSGAPATSAANVIVSSFASNPGMAPGGLAYVSGGSWEWKEYSPILASRLAAALNPTQCNDVDDPCMFPQGLDLNMSPLQAAGRVPCNISAAYTFSPADTFSDCRIQAGSAGFNITIPGSLNANVIASVTPATWETRLVVGSGTGTVNVVTGGGATLYEAGSTTTSVALAAQTPYILWCPRNGDSSGGTQAICYIYKEQN